MCDQLHAFLIGQRSGDVAWADFRALGILPKTAEDVAGLMIGTCEDEPHLAARLGKPLGDISEPEWDAFEAGMRAAIGKHLIRKYHPAYAESAAVEVGALARAKRWIADRWPG